MLFKLTFKSFEIIGIFGRFAACRYIRPFGAIFCIQLQPLFQPRFGIGQNRFGGAFGFANAAIDALAGVDDQHIVAFVKTIDRANFHTVHIFAADAGIGNHIGHW